MSEQRIPKWTGSLRIIPYLIGFIFLASAATLSLAIISAIQVYRAPLDESLWSYGLDHRWSLGLVGTMSLTLYWIPLLIRDMLTDGI